MHAHEKRLLFAIGVFVTLKRLKIIKSEHISLMIIILAKSINGNGIRATPGHKSNLIWAMFASF